MKNQPINQKYHAGMDWFSSKEAATKHAKKMEDQGYLTHYSFNPSSMYKSSSHTITHYFRDKDHQNEYRRQKYAEKKKKMSEEAPANVTAGVAKFDPLLGQKKKTRVLKRFKEM